MYHCATGKGVINFFLNTGDTDSVAPKAYNDLEVFHQTKMKTLLKLFACINLKVPSPVYLLRKTE